MPVTQFTDTPPMYAGPDQGGYSGRVTYAPREHGEPKPCPFCGGQDIEITSTHTASYGVECRDCFGTIGGDSFDGPFNTPQEFKAAHDAALSTAVQAWNRRAR